jgi:hypothetical protein
MLHHKSSNTHGPPISLKNGFYASFLCFLSTVRDGSRTHVQHSDVNGNPRVFLKYGYKVNYINMASMPLFYLSFSSL